MSRQEIRVAVRVRDPQALPNWVARLLRDMGATDHLECCALIVGGAMRRRPRVSWLVRSWIRIEASLTARSSPVKPRPTDLPVIAADDSDAIGALRADVILDVSGAAGAGLDPGAAVHGVWFCDCISEQLGLAGLRSLLRGDAVNPISLFRITNGGATATIASGAVNPKYVAARNELFLQEKSVALIARELRRLAINGSTADDASRPYEPCSAPRYPEFATYLGRVSRETLRRLADLLLVRLGFRPGMFQINSLAGDFTNFDPAAALANPPGGNVYHADPFLWQRGGKDYCFFETYDYRTAKGHISVGQLAEGQLTDVRPALCTDYHLSFPFLFEHAGELFMMPESCAMKRIEIWRCIEFPDRWELYSTALNGVMAADSSLAEIDGRWWLFSNIATDPFGDLNSELHLFQVDGPELRTIVPHPLNPVQFDARVARNAGRVIRHGDALLRPAQENSHGTYGYGLNLMRIEALSMDCYSEALVRSIRPDFGINLIGCHHVDARGDLIVFDSRRKIGGRAAKLPPASPVAA
jgi:hypothetical protein